MQTKVKRIIAAALALVLALSLAACGSKNGGGKDNGSTGNNGDSKNSPVSQDKSNSGGGSSPSISQDENSDKNGDTFEYGNGTDYIANHLKGDYSITYRWSSSGDNDSDYSEMTYARTSEGYYYSYLGSESLFIKNGDKYDTYSGNKEDGFTKVDYMEPIAEDIVAVQMGALTWMMSIYESFVSDMKKDGTETVAGRDCDKYSFSLSELGLALKYTCCIDKATGVCLKYTYDAAVKGESGGMAFECIEFKTSGVTLPAYQK